MGAPDRDREAIEPLLRQLSATILSIERIPVSSYEELDGAALLPLLAETRAALVAAVDGVSQVLAHYDAIATQRASQLDLEAHVGETPRELCGEVERAMVEDVGLRRIQNLAFIARMGLRARVTMLDGLGEAPGKWELIAAAGSALREIMKALGALAVAVCAAEGLPEPATFYVTELERSLAVRRAYRIFHADVAPGNEPTGLEVKPRLRRAANAMAKLVGRPIYASMRVHDRFSLRAMQRRLHAWLALAGAASVAHEAAGVRLFQDLAHLTELMMAVNERAELRAHDARVIEAQIGALEAGHAELAGALSALRAIEGRDAWLDAVMTARAPIDEAALLARLRALRQKLSPRHPSEPAPRPAPADLTEGDDFI
jgi:hypothetical protein